MNRFFSSLAICLLLSACATPPPPLPSSPQYTGPLAEVLPADSLVVTGVLDNGFRYVIRSNAKPENRAELRLVVDAESVLEDSDQQGCAHFVEHMAFNGTKNFEKQVVDYLEA